MTPKVSECYRYFDSGNIQVNKDLQFKKYHIYY